MSTQQSVPPTYPPQPNPEPKRLMRSSDDKMVAGVCGGIGRYLGVDPTLVRVAAVVALVLGFPATVIAYVVAWAIMPTAVEVPGSDAGAQWPRDPATDRPDSATG